MPLAEKKPRALIIRPDSPKVIPFTRKEPQCPICKGARWLRTQEEYNGRTPMVKCAACAGDVAAKRQADLVARLFGGAHFPFYADDWTFESYPANADQDALHEVRSWVNRNLMEDSSIKRGLYLGGGPGRCKTGLAISALKLVLRQADVGLFVMTLELINRLRASYGKQSEDEPDTLLQAVTSVPWLVMDDLAVERPSEYVLEQLYYIIEKRRASGLYTIFTSNLSTSDLEKYWRPDAEKIGAGGFHAGVRVTERLRDYCLGITVKGRNSRSGAKG